LQVHVPSIYCHRLVLGKNYKKPIERPMFSRETTGAKGKVDAAATTPAARMRETIARRAALEFKDGMYGK
jgi:3-oxoacid CoA-transferase